MLHWTTTNPTPEAAVVATQAVLGPIITLDVSPPKFTYLKAEGTNENEITVTFDLNEAGTAYCRATRSDSGEATMHINRILKAALRAHLSREVRTMTCSAGSATPL